MNLAVTTHLAPRTLGRVALRFAVCLFVVAACSHIALAQLSMLHTSGRNIVNANGQTVVLKGMNLGGLFVMEQWMTPYPSSYPDMYSVMSELDSRFGVTEEQALIRGYQQSWITTQDFVNMKNLGFNVVRVPVWWGNFYPLGNVSNSSWRSDAFTQLDWVVSQAAAQGIYVIIDMHGLVGGQSNSQDTGQSGVYNYWSNSNDQGNSAYMWWEIANHYNGNPTVAGYDLINEPQLGMTSVPSEVISAYASLYNSVRSADPSHIIIMEGAFGNWDWSMLPNPSSEGWTNVVYEMHEYQYGGSQAQVTQGSINQVSDFNNHASYNVPDYIGEWNDMGYAASVYQGSYNEYTNNGVSSTMWTYKTSSSGTYGWGLYNTTASPTVPNISSDSAATIASDWAQWTTANAYALNTSLGFTPGSGGGGATLTTGTPFNIVNQNSGSCVDATGWGTANGTTVQQWACSNGSDSTAANQEWEFTSAGGGYYEVTNVNAPAEAWNVVNNGTSNGSLMQLWTYAGNSNEEWEAVSLGNGYYKFIGKGSGLCLDTPSASTANGVQLDIYTCNGTAAQAFKLVTP